MDFRVETANGHAIVVLPGDSVQLTDEQSALDLIGSVNYLYQSNRIVAPKEAIADSFFELRTGVAGAILQKFINYDAKLAIVGDFSNVASRALRDFIYECNNGRDIFFVATEEEALKKLSR